METNTFEFILAPYTKLYLANMELLKNIPQTADPLLRANENVQGSTTHTQDTRADASSRSYHLNFWIHVMGNWVEFWGDLHNCMAMLLGQNQQAMLQQDQDTLATGEAAQNEAVYGRTQGSRKAA